MLVFHGSRFDDPSHVISSVARDLLERQRAIVRRSFTAFRMTRQIFIFILCVFFINPSSAASHHPQDFLKSIEGSKTEGKQIVQHYCALCHAEKPLVQIGAPRMNQSADWGSRVKQGIDVLLKHTDEGINAMPARGGCFECSDKQLMLAIIALLPKELAQELNTK